MMISSAKRNSTALPFEPARKIQVAPPFKPGALPTNIRGSVRTLVALAARPYCLTEPTERNQPTARCLRNFPPTPLDRLTETGFRIQEKPIDSHLATDAFVRRAQAKPSRTEESRPLVILSKPQDP